MMNVQETRASIQLVGQRKLPFLCIQQDLRKLYEDIS